MKILVCGSRTYNNEAEIKRVLDIFVDDPAETTIIHGNAKGADRLAGRVAYEMGCNIIAVPADWDVHGKAAGMIRNQKMLDMKPDLVLAFFDPEIPMAESRGTSGMVRIARAAGVEVMTYQ